MSCPNVSETYGWGEFTNELSNDFTVRDDKTVAVIEDEPDSVEFFAGDGICKENTFVFDCVVCCCFDQFGMCWDVLESL